MKFEPIRLTDEEKEFVEIRRLNAVDIVKAARAMPLAYYGIYPEPQRYTNKECAQAMRDIWLAAMGIINKGGVNATPV